MCRLVLWTARQISFHSLPRILSDLGNSLIYLGRLKIEKTSRGNRPAGSCYWSVAWMKAHYALERCVRHRCQGWKNSKQTLASERSGNDSSNNNSSAHIRNHCAFLGLVLFWVFGHFSPLMGLPRWLSSKESVLMQETRVWFLDWENPLKWQPTPIFLPGKFHRHKSLVGYSPWDFKRVRHSDWATTIKPQSWEAM